MDGQIFLTNTTEYVASAVATGTNNELSDIKSMMKQIEAYGTAQAETVETLSTKMNGGSSGFGGEIDKKKARPGLHVCAHFKRGLYHRDRNCLEL